MTKTRPKVGEPKTWGYFKWGFAVALCASLLFAHGCHGDEDHELFAAIVQSIGL